MAELDPQSITLAPLQDRLSKVLIVEADKGLLAKEGDRVFLLIQSLAARQLQPAEQTRLSNALAAQYFENCQQQVAAGDLQGSVSTFERLLALGSVDEEKKQQAVTALLLVIKPLCLTGLQSQDPMPAIDALKHLKKNDFIDQEFEGQLRDVAVAFQHPIKVVLLDDILPPLASLSPSVVLALTFDEMDKGADGTPVAFLSATSEKQPVATQGALTVTGIHGNALNLQGKHLDIPRENLPLGDSPRTVAFWIRLDGSKLTAAAVPFMYGTWESEDGVYIIANHRGTRPCVGNAGGKNEPLIDANVIDNEWHHLALVYDGNGTVTCFCDKEEKVRFKKSLRTSWGDGYKRKVDTGSFLGDQCFGAMDDFIVLSRALSLDEVRGLAEEGISYFNVPSSHLSEGEGTAPASLATGLVAYYPFNGDAKDESGNGHHGDLKGAISAPDRHGNLNAAYAFDGKYLVRNSTPVVLPACPPLGKSPRTISVWAKTATHDTQLLFDYGGGVEGDNTAPPGSAFQVTLSYGSNGMTASTRGSAVTYQADYTDNQWHHFVWIVPDTERPATADIQLFLDGTLVSVSSRKTHDVNSALAVKTTKTKIVVGQQFTGELDDIRIYDRALTSEDVADLFKVEKPADVSRGLAMPGIAVAPFDEAQAEAHQKAWADYLGVPAESTNSIGMKLVVIPPGEFMMGSPDSDLERQGDETHHRVSLARSFRIGAYEVTQTQYEKVMGENPSHFKGPDNPVDTVSWDDAMEFCHRLSGMPKEKAVKNKYRLPTEAEWEFACRATTMTAYSFGDDELKLTDFAWFDDNSGDRRVDRQVIEKMDRETYDKWLAANNFRTHAVGTKDANGFGLYDMHGNVWEWCLDIHAVLPAGFEKDPSGPSTGSNRSTRGGSADSPPEFCRSSSRLGNAPSDLGASLGFRVYCELESSPETAVAPFDTAQAKAHQKAWADHLGVPVISTNSIGMKFALIPAGRFEMGSPDSEPDRVGNELLHNVQISRAYGMSVFEVTQEQFESVLNEKIRRVPGDAIPVGDISWEDANRFCHQLSEIAEEKSVGRIYRLPTEAEWEFACRAGTKTRFVFGKDDRQAEKHAWLKSNSDGRPHKIGLKKPNAWGLYDMHGNVWEWCSDWVGDYPSESITRDQVGPASGPFHVGRGGGWVHDPKDLRAAFRLFGAPTGGYPDLGFRVVLVIQ